MKPLLLYLNLTFLIFLLSYRSPQLASLHVLTTLMMLLWATWREDDVYFTRYDLALFALIFFNILLIPLLGVGWRELAFLVQFSLAILVFRRTQLDLPTFLKYANLTYALYVMLSYLVYFGVLTPGMSGNLEAINQFDVIYFGLAFKTLIGFNGTTAGIDAYSALIFLLNVAYWKHSRFSPYFALLALFNVLWTTRLTPLAVLIVPGTLFLLTPKMRRGPALTILLLLIFLSPFLPRLLLNLGAGNEILFEIATHGRSNIWEQYSVLMANAPLSQQLLGFRARQLPEVFLWGTNVVTDNPHSSYLRILLAFGWMQFLMFVAYIFHRVRRSVDDRQLFLLLGVLVAGITNVNIVYNHNPIYIFLFLQLAYGVAPLREPQRRAPGRLAVFFPARTHAM